MYMSQFNINMTPDFEADLKRFMKVTKIAQKAEALRTALKTALLALTKGSRRTDWESLVGVARKGVQNPKPRFKNEDDLWS